MGPIWVYWQLVAFFFRPLVPFFFFCQWPWALMNRARTFYALAKPSASGVGAVYCAKRNNNNKKKQIKKKEPWHSRKQEGVIKMSDKCNFLTTAFEYCLMYISYLLGSVSQLAPSPWQRLFVIYLWLELLPWCFLYHAPPVSLHFMSLEKYYVSACFASAQTRWIF